MLRAVLLSLAFIGAAAFASEEVLSSPYLPMQVGAKWEFQTNKGKAVSEITSSESVRGLDCVHLQTTMGEMEPSEEIIGVSPAGVCRLAYGSTALEPAVLMLKLNPKAGDRWDSEITEGAQKIKGTFSVTEEDVKVPAGAFHTFCVTGVFQVQGNSVTTKTWYAKNVGIVKQLAQSGANQVTSELTRYTPGAKQ